MATFEVVAQQGLRMIKATINNETIRAEAGALHYMQGNVEMESKAPSAGGFLKALVTQESIFRPTYRGTGTIFFGPPTFGEYTTLTLNNEAWILDKGAYVCSDMGVEVGVHRNNLGAGMLAGEGLFQTIVKGTGTVIIQSPGPLQAVDLVNDRLMVDGNFAVARQAHLSFDVRRASKGLLGSMTSGEGLLSVIEGTGRVLISPVPNLQVSLIAQIIAAMPRPTTSG